MHCVGEKRIYSCQWGIYTQVGKFTGFFSQILIYCHRANCTLSKKNSSKYPFTTAKCLFPQTLCIFLDLGLSYLFGPFLRSPEKQIFFYQNNGIYAFEADNVKTFCIWSFKSSYKCLRFGIVLDYSNLLEINAQRTLQNRH